MEEEERSRFMTAWADAIRPAMRGAIVRLLGDVEVDGRPASKADIAVLLRHMFADDATFALHWGTALNEMKIQLAEAGMVPTEEETVLARQVILDVLDQELAAHSH